MPDTQSTHKVIYALGNKILLGGQKERMQPHPVTPLWLWHNDQCKNCPKHSPHPHRTISVLKHSPHGKETSMFMRGWAKVTGPRQSQAWRVRTQQHTRTLFPVPLSILFATLIGLPQRACTYHRQNSMKVTGKEIDKQNVEFNCFNSSISLLWKLAGPCHSVQRPGLVLQSQHSAFKHCLE